MVILFLKLEDVLVVEYFRTFGPFVGNYLEHFPYDFGLLILEFDHAVGNHYVFEGDNVHENFIQVLELLDFGSCRVVTDVIWMVATFWLIRDEILIYTNLRNDAC